MFELGRTRVRKRLHLPHWHTQYGVYFVTWHLADAIPAAAREALRAERDYMIAALREKRSITPLEKSVVDRMMRRRVEHLLDRGHGACVLRRPEAASKVAEALEHFDGERYELFSWCVMPNHVHCVFSRISSYSLDRILHSWKSYTSKQVNQVLGRSGVLWQEDYFDRSTRSRAEFQRTVQYVIDNPARAGLGGWDFLAAYPERIARLL